MKFLIDAQLPPGFAGWFEARGHAAVHVFDVGLGAARDAAIAARAESENEVLVSKDEDFLILRCQIALPCYGCAVATPPIALWLNG